jgi:hypothetical protein
MTPCDLAGDYQHFGEKCRLNVQSVYPEDEGEKFLPRIVKNIDGVTTQKTTITFSPT